MAQAAWIDLHFCRKKPDGRIAASNASRGASAKSRALRYLANSSGVMRLTVSSVDWAERIVAINNCKAES